MIKKGEISMQFIVIIIIIIISLVLIILFISNQSSSADGSIGLLKNIFSSARR